MKYTAVGYMSGKAVAVLPCSLSCVCGFASVLRQSFLLNTLRASQTILILDQRQHIFGENMGIKNVF